MGREAKASAWCFRGSAFIIFLFVSGILVPCACSAQENSGMEVLTLAQAIETALRNQPLIEAQQGAVFVGKARVGQAKGSYYPHLSISSAYTKISPVENRTSATTSNAGLPPGSSIPTGITTDSEPYRQTSAVGSLNQLIFDFGRTSAQIGAQRANAEAAGFELDNVRGQVVYNVKEAFYYLLNAERSRDVAEEAVEQFRRHLEYARSQYEAGIKPRFDVTKAEVDLSNAAVNLIKAKNGVRYYRTNLNGAMGISYLPDYRVEEGPAKALPEQTFEEAVKKAFRNRPDLLSLQKQEESAQKSVQATRRSRYPSLNGTANYTYVGSDFPLDSGWIAGVNVIFPLFTGFTTTYQVQEAQANQAILAANERSLRQKIITELEQGFLALDESAERMKSTEVAVRQAKENLELAQERYSSGLAIAVELTDAVVSYANAQLAYNAAYYDHRIAQAKIARALGEE